MDTENKVPASIDEYIAAFSPEQQKMMNVLRREIKKSAPEVIEKISWGMPTFYQSKNIIHFAACKKHIGIYPGSEAIEHFADRISCYKCSVGGFQLPLDQPIPFDLINDIIKFNLNEAELNALAQKTKKEAAKAK